MTKMAQTHRKKKAVSAKAAQCTTEKKRIRNIGRSGVASKASKLLKDKSIKKVKSVAASALTGSFKVDKSPAARAFAKAASLTHKRLYGEE